MKYGILFFSGTGCTELAAQKLSEKLSRNNGEVQLINVSKNDSPPANPDFDILIMMFVVHASGAPEPFYKIIKQFKRCSNPRRAVILSVSAAGEVRGNRGCRLRVKKELSRKNYSTVYEDMVTMPCNWASATSDELAYALINALDKKMGNIAEVLEYIINTGDSDTNINDFNINGVGISNTDINDTNINGISISNTDISDSNINSIGISDTDINNTDINNTDLNDTDISGLAVSGKISIIDRLIAAAGTFSRKVGFPLMGKSFKADSRCNGCQICAENCPNHNIAMQNGKPKFGWHCLVCMRCIYNCPENAISAGIFNFIIVDGGFDIKRLSENAKNNKDYN